MKVLIAGGTGFLGRHLASSLLADSHQVWVLTRKNPQGMPGVKVLLWDGRSTNGWGQVMNDMEWVVNLSGLSLHAWPWTRKRVQQFHDSRVDPGLALASAIKKASRRPEVFIQISGINHYGLQGEAVADESTPPGEDYLAQLTVAWEYATASIEDLGLRRVVCRTAVVLARDAILFWLMALPVKLFVGGPLGSGRQALPWIHVEDVIGAIRFLLEDPDAKGPFNLIAPERTSNADFMRAQAKALHRPYWFPVPEVLLRLVLGKMNVLVTQGRFADPRNLLRLGYQFQFPDLQSALHNLVNHDTK